MHRSRTIELVTGIAVVLVVAVGGTFALTTDQSALWMRLTVSIALRVTAIGLLATCGFHFAASRRELMRGDYKTNRTVIATETTIINARPEHVWTAVEQPELAPMLRDEYRSGRRVTDTSSHTVGEQHAFELHDGSTLVVEVTEIEPGKSTTVVQVSPPNRFRTRHRFRLEAIADGTKYTAIVEIDLPKGYRLSRWSMRRWRAQTKRHFQLLSSLLDADHR